MNHREGERHPTDLPVTVQVAYRGPTQARLRDVSLSGAGIEYPDWSNIHPMETVELVIEYCETYYGIDGDVAGPEYPNSCFE